MESESSKKSILVVGGTSKIFDESYDLFLKDFEIFYLIYHQNENQMKKIKSQLEAKSKQVFDFKTSDDNSFLDHIGETSPECVFLSHSSPINIGNLHKKDKQCFMDYFENQVVFTHKIVQKILPSMLKKRNGLFIVISSKGVETNAALMADYLVGKAAFEQYVKLIETEYTKKGIKIEIIRPNMFPSPLNESWPKIGVYGGDGKESIQEFRETLSRILSKNYS